MKYKRKKELEKLIKHLQDDYGNDYLLLSRYLHRMAYCLHFVHEDDVSRKELQELSFMAYELSECFHAAYQVTQQQRKERMTKVLDKFPKPSELL